MLTAHLQRMRMGLPHGSCTQPCAWCQVHLTAKTSCAGPKRGQIRLRKCGMTLSTEHAVQLLGQCLQLCLARALFSCQLHQRSPQPIIGKGARGWAGQSPGKGLPVPLPKNQHPRKAQNDLQLGTSWWNSKQSKETLQLKPMQNSGVKHIQIKSLPCPLCPQRQAISSRFAPRCSRDFWWLPACSQLHTVAGKAIFFLPPPWPALCRALPFPLRALSPLLPLPPSASDVVLCATASCPRDRDRPHPSSGCRYRRQGRTGRLTPRCPSAPSNQTVL